MGADSIKIYYRQILKLTSLTLYTLMRRSHLSVPFLLLFHGAIHRESERPSEINFHSTTYIDCILSNFTATRALKIKSQIFATNNRKLTIIICLPQQILKLNRFFFTICSCMELYSHWWEAWCNFQLLTWLWCWRGEEDSEKKNRSGVRIEREIMWIKRRVTMVNIS